MGDFGVIYILIYNTYHEQHAYRWRSSGKKLVSHSTEKERKKSLEKL
jgi:hypothetical protein